MNGASHRRTAEPDGSKSEDRSRDLLGADDGAGIVRDIDIESGVHRLIRIIRCRVSHHRDLVAELRRKANGLNSDARPFASLGSDRTSTDAVAAAKPIAARLVGGLEVSIEK
jgi:hypothetical protein